MYERLIKEKNESSQKQPSKSAQVRQMYVPRDLSNDLRILYKKNTVLQMCGDQQEKKQAQLARNQQVGAAAENEANRILARRHVRYERQVTLAVESDEGKNINVRADAIGQDEDGNFVIYEIKASMTAPLTSNQKKAYPLIYEKGARIISPRVRTIFGTDTIPPGTDGFRVDMD